MNPRRIFILPMLLYACVASQHAEAGVITIDYNSGTNTWNVSGHTTAFPDTEPGNLTGDPAQVTGGDTYVSAYYHSTYNAFAALQQDRSNNALGGSEYEYFENAAWYADDANDSLSFSIVFTGDVIWQGVRDYTPTHYLRGNGNFYIEAGSEAVGGKGTVSNAPNKGDSLSGLTANVTLSSYASGSASNTFYSVDFVTSAAVPEPSTAIAMGLLGVLGFAGNRRRRRQVSAA